jgi:quercetin dioxygenase-like cupin family protein
VYSKAHFEFGEVEWIQNLKEPLGLTGVAVSLIRVPAGKGYTFTHRHKEQEEVYIAVEGRGSIFIDGELLDFVAGDVVRVPPEARRALKAADGQDLFLICAGGATKGYPKGADSEHLIDDGMPNFDDVPPWYEGNAKIRELNERLRSRRFGQGPDADA